MTRNVTEYVFGSAQQTLVDGVFGEFSKQFRCAMQKEKNGVRLSSKMRIDSKIGGSRFWANLVFHDEFVYWLPAPQQQVPK